jgi:uncharacterized protein (TIGR03032 family)
LKELPRAHWYALGYEALVADPRAEIEKLSAFLDLDWDRPPPLALPPSAVSLSAPDPDKWRRNAEDLAPHVTALEAMQAQIEAFTGVRIPAPDELGARAATARKPALPAASDASEPDAASIAGGLLPRGRTQPDALDPRTQAQVRALASVHTSGFVQALTRAGVSLAVSTYQAGKLVLVRADGESVNTAFKEMRKPMGIAFDGARLAIGSAGEVQQFQLVPSAARRLDPDGRVDAAWLPRAIHFTGNIDIHEMAFAGDALWAVNTRFGCLCTFDPGCSFVPRWKPSFLSALAPEDRCHLNGLAVRDGQVRYVTLLGRSDEPGGWRANKADGGELIDLQQERVLCAGLSMPHSPRWYRDRLWVLESGNGGLCQVDPESGARETLIELPGFTRGLDFFGPLAFVGLSQVRESAVFAKLPLTERLSERICGVWVVNIEKRTLVGFLRFEDAVQEIFAVTVLSGQRYPELLLPGDALTSDTFVLPEAPMHEVSQPRRAANAGSAARIN